MAKIKLTTVHFPASGRCLWGLLILAAFMVIGPPVQAVAIASAEAGLRPDA